jgi:hypothetical protein
MWSRSEPAEPAASPAGGRYTAKDTPEVVRRVERDLGLVLREARAADPGLRALVLTGGFARGEGSVRGGVPQNDYDLVALRSARPPGESYGALRARLEPRLGLHLDLQPVWVGRLRWTRPSIFWYETALRGRVLWGDASLLGRIPTRRPGSIDASEGLRLLVNRAAGLLLAEPRADPDELRIQASKGLLAALDAHLLAAGAFAPSQVERWALYEALARAGRAPAALQARHDWLAWGFGFKVLPDEAEARNPSEAWRAAAEAILDALPAALAASGHGTLEAYARADSAASNLLYFARAGRVSGARRWTPHATGRVRALTLAMLAERVHGDGAADAELAALFRKPPLGRVEALHKLRESTLQ